MTRAIAQDMTGKPALGKKAQILRQALGGPVAGQHAGLQPLQLQRFEGVGDERVQGLAAIAIAPLIAAEQKADLAPAMGEIQMAEIDAADGVSAPPDRPIKEMPV